MAGSRAGASSGVQAILPSLVPVRVRHNVRAILLNAQDMARVMTHPLASVRREGASSGLLAAFRNSAHHR